MSAKKWQKQVGQLIAQYQLYWLNRMRRLSQSAVVWDGLPDYLDTVYMENCLSNNGSAIIVHDEILDRYFAGMNSSTGNLDYDGIPYLRAITHRNGETITSYDNKNSVIIFNNSDRTSDLWIFQMLAQEMAEIDMAIRINMITQRTMPIIPCNQNQKLSIENIYSAIENNCPYLTVDASAFDSDIFRQALTFDNRKSFTGDLMMQVQDMKWCRILSYIGINNTSIAKKERVVVPEVNANLDELITMRNDRIHARRQAAAKMKELWGWDIEVSYIGDQKGGVVGGNVYDASIDNLYATVDE